MPSSRKSVVGKRSKGGRKPFVFIVGEHAGNENPSIGLAYKVADELKKKHDYADHEIIIHRVPYEKTMRGFMERLENASNDNGRIRFLREVANDDIHRVPSDTDGLTNRIKVLYEKEHKGGVHVINFHNTPITDEEHRDAYRHDSEPVVDMWTPNKLPEIKEHFKKRVNHVKAGTAVLEHMQPGEAQQKKEGGIKAIVESPCGQEPGDFMHYVYPEATRFLEELGEGPRTKNREGKFLSRFMILMGPNREHAVDESMEIVPKERVSLYAKGLAQKLHEHATRLRKK